MSDNSSGLPQRIAELALNKWNQLPRKCKPRTLPDGRREWTPMSAVAVYVPGAVSVCLDAHSDSSNRRVDGPLKIVSLATGTKCLPASSIPNCDGSVLHDCHAEVLAMRGFNLWLLREIRLMLENETCKSDFLEHAPTRSKNRPFKFKPGAEIYLFTTEAPCGDASMELLMSSNSSNSSQPWSSDALAADLQSGVPLGRGHFSHLGVMRRKPARGDAEPSLSMSCSDKIALKQILGMLCFPADLFIEMTEECFMKGLITYEEQYSPKGYRRAFGRGGRLERVSSEVKGQVGFFHIYPLGNEYPRFEFGKQPNEVTPASGSKTSNVSAVWVAGSEGEAQSIEVLVGGVKQGYRQFSDRSGKQSILSRRRMFESAQALLNMIEIGIIGAKDGILRSEGNYYQDFKTLQLREGRNDYKRRAKELMGGWRSNSYQDNPAFPCNEET